MKLFEISIYFNIHFVDFPIFNIFKSTQFDESVSECLCLPPFFVPICYSCELSVVGCLYSLCYKCCELI